MDFFNAIVSSPDFFFLKFQNQKLGIDIFIKFLLQNENEVPLLTLKKYNFLVVGQTLDDLLFYPVDHGYSLTLERQVSRIPQFPPALPMLPNLEKQVSVLKERLVDWLQAPSWSVLEKGWQSVHPFDASRTITYQVNPQLLLVFLSAVNLHRDSYLHFQWRWVNIDEKQKTFISTCGFHGATATEDAISTHPFLTCLCLVPWHPLPHYPLYHRDNAKPIYDGRFVLPVGFYDPAPTLTFTDLTLPNLSNVSIKPFGLAIYQEELYVTDSANHEILVFTLAGDLVRTWGTEGTQAGEFKTPSGITVFQDQVYVADSFNKRVQVFSLEGHFIQQWTTYGLSDKPFSFLQGLTIGYCEGQVLIFVTDTHQIKVFNSKGSFIYCWEVDWCTGIALANDLVYVTDLCGVSVFTIKGHLIKSWRCFNRINDFSIGAINGYGLIGNFDRVSSIKSIAVYQNQVLVADEDQLQIFNLQGNLIKQVTQNLLQPTGIVVANDKIYVADREHGAIFQ